MYPKIEEITNETPVSFLTVGQLIYVLKKSEGKDIPSHPLPKPIPEIFGIEIVVELTGYSKQTIYQKTSKNEIPHFKRDSKLLFRRDDIMAWLTEKPIDTIDQFSRKMDEKFIKRRR